MEAALSIIMAMCLNSGNNYHACHQELVECTKEVSEQHDLNLWEAAKWCDSYAKQIDQALFKQEKKEM